MKRTHFNSIEVYCLNCGKKYRKRTRPLCGTRCTVIRSHRSITCSKKCSMAFARVNIVKKKEMKKDAAKINEMPNMS